ncbi:hypothetical protein ACFL1X_03330 [Candidatus Hydrogenedentota bacterium]
MAICETTKEKVRFLSQEPAQLRSMRGSDLYETLRTLSLNYSQFFKAAGTSVEAYCAEEFGVDLKDVSVERFFQSDPNAKWLFPDIVRESVVAGMKRKPAYPELIIRDESVSGATYDVPYVNEDAGEEELRGVAEGAAIPESEISYGDRVVRLDKKGRGIVASYEVIRRMSVEMLRVHLMRIGERLGRNLDERLADVFVNGDSSDGSTSPTTINTATSGAWVYGDIVNGFMTLGLTNYFSPTHMLANSGLAQTILNMTEFKDTVLFDFAKTGNMPSPLGAKLVPMADHPADKLTVLDRNFAVQKLTEQDVMVESDKLINQQWDRSYVSVITDFAVIYKDARVVVQSDWS